MTDIQDRVRAALHAAYPDAIYGEVHHRAIVEALIITPTQRLRARHDGWSRGPIAVSDADTRIPVAEIPLPADDPDLCRNCGTRITESPSGDWYCYGCDRTNRLDWLGD